MPSAPLAFYTPLETLLDPARPLTRADVLHALPPRIKASQQVAFAYFLLFSSPAPTLDNYVNPILAADPRTSEAVARFKEGLLDAENWITNYNESRKKEGRRIDFIFALPTQCNVSIGI